MLELHYPTVTKTILERQYPGKPTLKVAFGNDNGAIFENSSKLRASPFVTSRWPRSSGPSSPPPRLLKPKEKNFQNKWESADLPRQEVAGSNAGRTNTQDLYWNNWEESAAFVMT